MRFVSVQAVAEKMKGISSNLTLTFTRTGDLHLQVLQLLSLLTLLASHSGICRSGPAGMTCDISLLPGQLIVPCLPLLKCCLVAIVVLHVPAGDR